MKRIILLAVLTTILTTILALGAGPALSKNPKEDPNSRGENDSRGEGGPKFDLVAGTGSLGEEFGSPKVHVNAKEVSEDEAKGKFTIKYPAGDSIKGSITCMNVEDDTAYLVGQVEKSKDSDFEEDQYIVIGIQDNGEPGAGSDKLNFSPGLDTEPACAPNTQASPDLTIVKGNYVVKDN